MYSPINILFFVKMQAKYKNQSAYGFFAWDFDYLYVS